MAYKTPEFVLFVQQFVQKKLQSCTTLSFCVRNPLVTCGFPPQRDSNVEIASMPWHHASIYVLLIFVFTLCHLQFEMDFFPYLAQMITCITCICCVTGNNCWPWWKKKKWLKHCIYIYISCVCFFISAVLVGFFTYLAKGSLEWSVLCVMSFDIDICLQGHCTMTLWQNCWKC